MNRYFPIFLCLALVSPCFGDKPERREPPRPDQSQAPRAWLGVSVAKLDQGIAAHLPELPPGIGFVVKSLDPGGPGEAAGIQEQDVIWKYRDQLLVNESQLAALLRLAKPGDEVQLESFRAGKALTVKVKLGENRRIFSGFPEDAAEAAIFPGQNGPTRVINVAQKLASFTTDKGRAVVRREGEIYKVVIRAPDDRLIYEGDLSEDDCRDWKDRDDRKNRDDDDDDRKDEKKNDDDSNDKQRFDRIPGEWRRAVCALRRGLDHALEGRMDPVRQPRPRVVPPPVPVE